MRPIALIVPVITGAALAQPSFHALGYIDPELGGPSLGFAISADGSVVVGMSNSKIGFQAFRWSEATGMLPLGAFAGDQRSSTARGVSLNGAVICGASMLPDSLNEDGSPCRWAGVIGPVYLGTLGGTSSGGWGNAVTDDGEIIVGSANSSLGDYRAYTWTLAAGPVALPGLPGQSGSVANGVSDGAAVVVGSANDHPCRWTASGIEPLSELNPLTIGSASDVTPDGTVVVGQSAGRAVRWVNGAIQNLGLLSGGSAQTLYYGTAVSDDGQTVVGLGNFNPSKFNGAATIWEPAHGMRRLSEVAANEHGINLNGFELFWARGISADGKVIAGYGFSLEGQEAFVLDLREPAVCYPDCNGDGALNLSDFGCFQTKFALGDPYADCNGDGLRNLSDFGCFQIRFALGCP